MVMITSAGCNALDYLLDEPAEIHSVDMNPRQNAVLELKRASFQELSFDDHFQLFGTGAHPAFQELYSEQLRPVLPAYAQEFWDKNTNYFSEKGVRKSFYYYGTSGALAWMMYQYFKTRPGIAQRIDALFRCDDLQEQRALYEELEPKLVNQLIHWAVNQHLVMCLIGVPRSQQELFRDKYDDGATGFLKECLRGVFTRHLMKDNYFWRLYWEGKYEKDCCPEYLRESNFGILGERQSRIHQYTTTLQNFLERNPSDYSHYVLLDHQDWLAANNRPALDSEWRAILENSRSGTKILLRSAAHEIDFFPDFVLDQVEFVPQEELRPMHKADRVGTYASVYLGEVK